MSTRTAEDRASSCAFLFADGRQCRMLRSSHSKYCYHHTRKLHPAGELHQILRDLTEPASPASGPATALAHILSRTCTSAVEGRISTRQANAIASAAGMFLKSLKSLEARS